jgi:hypothetical protein
MAGKTAAMNTYFSGIDLQRPMAADQSFPGLICAPARLHPDRSSKLASYRRITHNSLYGNAHLRFVAGAAPEPRHSSCCERSTWNKKAWSNYLDATGRSLWLSTSRTPSTLTKAGVEPGALAGSNAHQPLIERAQGAASEAAEIGGHRAAWPAPNKKGWVACLNCA